MTYTPNSPRYATVQQRSKQREAARLEALATAIVPLVLMVSTLMSLLLYLSVKYAAWEKELHGRLSTSGLADGEYTPSLVAKPGLFITDHSAALKTLLFTAIAIGAIIVATKIVKRFT